MLNSSQSLRCNSPLDQKSLDGGEITNGRGGAEKSLVQPVTWPQAPSINRPLAH